MKKRAITVFVAALAMSMVCVLGGCSGASAGAPSSVGDGQPAPMPVNHSGRYMDLGDRGCYGCHGANEKANPQLVGAVMMPEDHYSQAMYQTMMIDPVYNQCITCHPQS